MNGFVTLLVTALYAPTVAKSGVYRRIRRARRSESSCRIMCYLCLIYHRVFRCNLDYLPRIRAAAQVSLAHTLVRLSIYDCAVLYCM